MTLTIDQLKVVNEHWTVKSIDEGIRDKAFAMAQQSLIKKALGNVLHVEVQSDEETIKQVASAYELAAIENIQSFLSPSSNYDVQALAKAGAYQAFELNRALSIPSEPEQRLFHAFHLFGLAYAGERWTDLKRWLEENQSKLQPPSAAKAPWNKRVVYRLYDAWVRLIRKNSWDDLQQISEIIAGLRKDQASYEKQFIDQTNDIAKKAEAVRLVALYHWAKATECLATFMLQGEPVAADSELDQHYEAAVKAAQYARDNELEMILRWLHVASRKMVEGSLWWVAHTVNSRVTRFVKHITQSRSMFELLPPQRAALQEQNLLDPASRAVVVDMPTSGGKTQLAQFRILQALNQFADDGGWVAYVAPTRALVSQIMRRLREDFGPLGIKVEQLSAAIDIDAFESSLLDDKDAFQVLVATPEKLQLVIRNKKIKRPMALLVMDEAHNIEDETRGLRIELLLATIKQEQAKANFLLLMPYVPNGNDLAQWLGSGKGKSISLSTSAWQPNERIIGLFKAVPAEGRGKWQLEYETLTTTQRTIHLHGRHLVGGVRPINLPISKTGSNNLAGAMAKVFSQRGTSIAVGSTIPNIWRTARVIAKSLEPLIDVPEEIRLVQRFLSTEISPEFELIGMLEKGIGVHHAGLPAEALSLMEWLTEEGHIRILCASMTIAQGLNFPVSSVFLASVKYPYGIKMRPREFWNLAGRAGRIGHDSVGVVGIAAGDIQEELKQFVSDATGELASRLTSMLDQLSEQGNLGNLTAVFHQEQWADFRSYIAHLWNEKKNLDVVIAEAEQLLRNTYGFSSLRAKQDKDATEQADTLLEVTKSYVRELADYPENAALADSTGFSPEGVRTALLGLNNLENKLVAQDWQPDSLFGNAQGKSALPELMGVMLKLPQLKENLSKLVDKGKSSEHLAEIIQAWVSGTSLADIAITYFSKGEDFTVALSDACKAVYRNLADNGAWGLSALSKMPTSGIDFENLSEEERRMLNNLPAMLYHGVKTEEGVLMRMNSVPRSIAERLGEDFKQRISGNTGLSPTKAADYINSLNASAWEELKPEGAALTGEDYRAIWKRLSGVR